MTSFSAGQPEAERPLHPRHGPHNPSTSTPARRPGSIRRTSVIEQSWPGAVGDVLVVRGRARDLLTPLAGPPHILGEATITCAIGYGDNMNVTAVETTPHEPGLQQLIGARASAGFRNAVDCAVPQQRDARSLLYMLLDDVPVATLVAGHAVMGVGRRRSLKPGETRLQHPDLCAGWASDGAIMAEIGRTGPPLVTGPAAPQLLCDDDDLAWLPLPPLPPHAMRRVRRLDLTAGETLSLDAFFRDSHQPPDGAEKIVHEYAVTAELDPKGLEFLRVQAEPNVLPFVECPGAIGSAGRLVGRQPRGLRSSVRKEFVGPTTCTHLNDTLRSLEDVVALAEMLRG